MTGEAGDGFRPGVRLALDWGQARIGVAACDARGTLAYPVETIAPASDLAVAIAIAGTPYFSARRAITAFSSG